MSEPIHTCYIKRGLAFAFAIAGSIAVGNLYWAQPLLSQIAVDFQTGAADVGLVATATQIGTAVGILTIVPLGDVRDRRRLLIIVMTACSLSLLACALAPSLPMLAIAFFAVGCTTVAGQIIMPMVGDLSAPHERGKMIGIITSGITMGMLLSRTVSGVIASIGGWRSVYLIAVVLNTVLIFVVVRGTPQMAPREHIPYPKLIGSVFTNLVRLSPMRCILLMQGSVFLVFNLFWTSVTFLLSEEPYGFDTFQIGLVSLAGLAGIAFSSIAGKLVDSGRGVPALAAYVVIDFASMMLAIFAGGSLALVVVAASVMAVAFLSMAVLNQTLLFSLDPAARSRLHTAFAVSNFTFGSIGCAVASVLWECAGWSGICAVACGVLVFSFSVWAIFRRMMSKRGLT